MRILVWQKEHTLYVWVSGMRKGGRVVSIAGNVCVNTAFSKLLLLNFSNLKKLIRVTHHLHCMYMGHLRHWSINTLKTDEEKTNINGGVIF